MRIVFLGTPEFAVPSLQALLEEPDFTVVAVVTQPDKRRGRGNQFTPSPIKKIALAAEIPVWQPKSIKKNHQTLEKLKQTEADVFVVVAYGQILSKEILAMPKLGCINVHGSLLPQYRGAAPIQWSLFNGDRQTGITTMLMDEGMDTGAMLLKTYTEVNLWTNGEELALTLAQQGAQLLKETLHKLPDIQPIAQNPEEASYAPPLRKQDYQLNWSKSAIAIHNQIRGFCPDCVTRWRDKELKILASAPLMAPYWSELPANLAKLQAQIENLQGAKGEIVSIAKNLGPIIQTGEGLLILLKVQLAGKRPQSGGDFVNGMRPSVGEKLG